MLRGSLLEGFKKEKIKIDYFTIYYGNNDNVWNLNREEKDWLKFARSKKQSLKNLSKNRNEIVVRVSVEDYKKNIGAVIETCRQNKIIPILIKPLTPIYWKPGTRVENEESPRKTGSAGSIPVFKKMVLEEVREKDFIVPRIKKSHLEKLAEIAKNKNVAFIDIKLDRSEDDIKYFIDYCHPIGEANKFITRGIAKEIKKFEKGAKKDSTANVKKLETKKTKNKIHSLKIKKQKISAMIITTILNFRQSIIRCIKLVVT